MEGSTATWLNQKLAGLSAGTTGAVVAHSSEVTDGSLATITGDLHKSEEWLSDLKLNGTAWLYHNGRRVLLAVKYDGKADTAEATRKGWRGLGAKTCVALKACKLDDAAIFATAKCSVAEHFGIFENAVRLTNYEKVFKKEPAAEDGVDPRSTKKATVIAKLTLTPEVEATATSKEVAFQQACARGTIVARDLCNTRGSVAHPGWMEQQVRELTKGAANVEMHVLQVEDLVANGMNMFHGVGRGAAQEAQPRCVMAIYRGNPESKDIDVAFVGKGVTYDTGGLNLKPTGSMEEMYGDKGGACAVVGALVGTIELGLKKNIVFACGFAENAIGANCYKPSDILKAMNGLHVEIGNTDAEGRLVLGDTMTFVQRTYKPKQLIDIATLTGAIMVALGRTTAGMFLNDDAIGEELKGASKESFEAVWHMPITDEHRNYIKGAYGDLSNMGSGGRFGGGSCSAAAFLENFVEPGVKWAHLDIAGPAMSSGNKWPVSNDQTGFGASLLLHFLSNKA